MSPSLLALTTLAMARPSVLVTDGLSPGAISLLSDSVRVVETHYSAEDLDAGSLAEHDAVIIRSATYLSAKAIAAGAAGKLRVIGRAGVGVDNIDVQAASNSGCFVLNTPGANTKSVSELTLAHMLAAARGMQQADAGLKSGRWLKGQLRLGAAGGPIQGHELAGKRLGILGFGRIAQDVARIASALGMEVWAHSRHPDVAAAQALGIELVPSLAELLSGCTHVVVLCSLSDETRGLLDRNRMDLISQEGADGTLCGAHLFNMARGGIVVEADAAAALEDGTLTTYATDVFEREPPLPNNPLLLCEGFHGTPHVGAATMEAQQRVGQIIARSVLAALSGYPPEDCIVAAPANSSSDTES